MNERDIRNVMESAPAVVPPMPEGAVIDLQVSDLDGASAVVLPNRAADAPVPGNLIALTSGTGDYHDLGPDGVLSATRVQLPADASGARDLVPGGVVLPAGTWTAAVQLRATTGAGAQSLKFGRVFSPKTTAAVDESGFVKVTSTFTLLAPSSTRIVLEHDGAPVDVLWDQLQLYPGTSVPTFAEDTEGYLTPFVRKPEALPVEDDALLTDGVQAFIPLPAYPQPTTIDELTMVAVVDTDDASVGPHNILSLNGMASGTFLGTCLGRFTASPVQNYSNSTDMLKIVGTGPRVLAVRMRSGANGESAMFIDGVKVLAREGAFDPEVARVIGAFISPPNPGVPPGQFAFDGRFHGAAVYDRWLNDNDMGHLCRSMRARYGVHIGPAPKPLNVLFLAGDSITSGENIDASTYGQQVFEDGLPGWIGVNYGKSGQQITYDRWPEIEAGVISAKEAGHRPVVSLAFGANHGNLDDADFELFEDRWDKLRYLGCETIVCDVLPRNLPGWEAKRLPFNARIHASTKYTVLCAWGSHPIMGNPATIPGPEWYDYTHPQGSTGHALLKVPYRGALEALP